MAIEKLPIRGYEPYGIPIVDKINEIIDYINRAKRIMKDPRTALYENCRKSYEVEKPCDTIPMDGEKDLFNACMELRTGYSFEKRQAILFAVNKLMEPNKVELVPLDDTDALANYLVSASKSYSGSVLKDHMMRVLSKYGVPTQKKFTRTSIGRYIQEKYGSRGEQIRTLELLAFLKDHNMLEE